MLFFSIHEFYPYDTYAVEDSYVCFIELELFEEMFINKSGFSYEFLQIFAQEMFLMRERAEFMPLMDTREKIAYSLIYIIDKFGVNNHNKINVNRKDISELAGTNIEQVTRQLSSLEKEGIIEKVKREIIIKNIKKLLNITKKYNM